MNHSRAGSILQQVKPLPTRLAFHMNASSNLPAPILTQLPASEPAGASEKSPAHMWARHLSPAWETWVERSALTPIICGMNR